MTLILIAGLVLAGSLIMLGTIWVYFAWEWIVPRAWARSRPGAAVLYFGAVAGVVGLYELLWRIGRGQWAPFW